MGGECRWKFWSEAKMDTRGDRGDRVDGVDRVDRVGRSRTDVAPEFAFSRVQKNALVCPLACY